MRLIAGAFLSQLFFSLNHMIILILGSIVAFYLLPTDYKLLATFPAVLMQITTFIFIPISRRFLSFIGHRLGFLTGNFCGLIGSFCFYFSITHSSYMFLITAMIFFGIHQSYASFLRYIVADNKPCCRKIQSISIVISASILAALIAPTFIRNTQDIISISHFSGTALILLAVNIIGLWSSFLITNNKHHDFETNYYIKWSDLKKYEGFKKGVSLSIISHSSMNMLMLTSPLAIIGCGMSVGDISMVMQIHMLAMFLPAFLTGIMIQKFGTNNTLLFGIMFLAITLCLFIVAHSQANILYFQLGMVTLGLGWGILYIASTGMIALCYCPCEASGIQEKSEMLNVGFSGLFAIIAGYLYSEFGWLPLIVTISILVAYGFLIIISEIYLTKPTSVKMVH